MQMQELAQTAIDTGWTEAATDRDHFGDYRSASWRNATGDQILHATASRERERAGIVSRVVVSTTDPLGWAATGIDEWTEADGNLDGALAHLERN